MAIAITIDCSDTLASMGRKTKSLTVEQNEHAREALRSVVDGDFGGNQSKAARAIGVGQSLISEVLAGKGVGPKLIQAIADYTGRSTDDLYGRPARPGLPNITPGYSLLRHHRDWESARAEALQRARTVREPDIDRVGTVALSQPPEELTADFVIRMAEALLFAIPYTMADNDPQGT